jgi:CIC family chloride channel protein
MTSFLTRFFSRSDTRVQLQLIFIAALVGICGGYASLLLNLALHQASGWLQPLRTEWYACFFPVIGIALAVVTFRYLFRDQGEHGVPEVIYAISKRGGLLRLRTSISRLLACLFTLVGGGSAGPEAPVVMSGASIGSNIASRFGLKDRQRIVIVGCGASAAIAAIFNAPATGIIFTMEAVIGQWSRVNLIPIAIASVVGTEVSRLLQGNQIPFAHRSLNVGHMDLLACIGLSVLTAISSVIFVRSLRFISHQMETRITSTWLRVGLGGTLVGAIGIFFPDALGEGYQSIRDILNNRYSAGLLFVGACILAKIVATAATTGAGGVGGVFAPCLAIGAMTGLFYREGLVLLFPGVTFAGQGYFGLLGMAGVVSSVLQTPLTGIFLIMEITGGHDVLLPVVLVAVLSSMMSGFAEPHSFYHRDLIRRGLLLRAHTDARVLSELKVLELLDTDCRAVSPQMMLGEFVQLIGKSSRNYFRVEDPDTHRFLGLINLNNVKSYLFEQHLHHSVLVEEIMDENITTVGPDDDLTDIIQIMDRTDAFSLPVVEHGKFLGLISKATLLDHYRKELIAEEDN